MSTDTQTDASGRGLEQPGDEQPFVHGGGAATGWYPDPNTEAQLRWWDGAAWTPDIRSFDDSDQIASPVHGHPLAAEPTDQRPAAPSVIARRLGLAVVVATALVLVLAGLGNSHEVEVVDVAGRMQPTGEFNLVESGQRICEPGEDYLGCLNAHVAAYNSVCAGQPLTPYSRRTCDALSRLIDEARDTYDECGYGCETGGERGEWGWPYLRLEPDEAWVPAVTHTEFCTFDLGPIQIGTCGT